MTANSFKWHYSVTTRVSWSRLLKKLLTDCHMMGWPLTQLTNRCPSAL